VLIKVVLCFAVVGYGRDRVGCGCGDGLVQTARSQGSSDAGEVHATMQRSHHQVSNLS